MEVWLLNCEVQMRSTLTKLIKSGKKDYTDGNEKRYEWVCNNKAQIVAVVCNILWTYQTEINIEEMEENPTALSGWYRVQILQLDELTALVAGDLTDLQRKSIIALITQDVHARDIIQEMAEKEVSLISDFLW